MPHLCQRAQQAADILKHEILSAPKLFALNEQHPIKPVGFDPQCWYQRNLPLEIRQLRKEKEIANIPEIERLLTMIYFFLN